MATRRCSWCGIHIQMKSLFLNCEAWLQWLCSILNRLGREAAWKEPATSDCVSVWTWLSPLQTEFCHGFTELSWDAGAADFDSCPTGPSVTMRGIWDSRVAALSQFTQAPGTPIFHLNTHTCTGIHTFTKMYLCERR